MCVQEVQGGGRGGGGRVSVLPLNFREVRNCLCFLSLGGEGERERASMCMSRGERQRGEREKTPIRLHTQHGAQCGAGSHDPGVKTWAQIKSRLLNRLNH